jgi:hypothetical protein
VIREVGILDVKMTNEIKLDISKLSLSEIQNTFNGDNHMQGNERFRTEIEWKFSRNW